MLNDDTLLPHSAEPISPCHRTSNGYVHLCNGRYAEAESDADSTGPALSLFCVHGLCFPVARKVISSQSEHGSTRSREIKLAQFSYQMQKTENRGGIVEKTESVYHNNV